jgi:RNA polymerase sigma factor (TIGR02999 family)
MSGDDITDMLRAARGGVREAVDALMPVLYDELHRLAQSRLALRPAQRPLDTTALLHEVYLRLIDQSRVEWPDRVHFYGYAAIAMRRIIVDHARRQQALKRGAEHASVDIAQLPAADPADVDAWEWIYLDQALDRLRACSPRLVQVVELRVFAGLSMDEISEILGISPRTAKRDWHKARLVLHQFMTAG